MTDFADIGAVVARAMRAWKPPPRLSLSEWADRYYYLSHETAAQPGKWRTLPYQRGILDAITDPDVEQVTLMKSARVGYTLCLGAAIGYHIHHEPSSMLMVQPTVEDAKGYSKESIAALLRDVPVLSRIMVRDREDKGPKDSSATLMHKTFPGGILSLTGANSGTGFRRISRRVILFDEIDAYPPSAGSEGDQIKLGSMRAQAFWNRKIIAGSTPLIAGTSRIEARFWEGDQRRFHVPCPQCGHMDFLSFRERSDGRGHWMQWPDGEPEKAYFVCRKNGCVIEHKHKRDMVAAGEWRADAEFHGHASYHIWAAYSFNANAEWGQIAKEFIEAKRGGPEKLRVFVNTVLGETWQEQGEAPDWQRLYQRREQYELATVPDGVKLITAGVDVQRDRLVWEVVGWGDDRQSWSIDAGVIPGDTSDTSASGPWPKLEELLNRQWPASNGISQSIRMMGVDSGDQTQTVYDWARRHVGRVIACKGANTPGKPIISPPKPVDVTLRGTVIRGGCKVWTIGTDTVKKELYGWLRLDPPMDDSGFPPGFCHFPQHGEEYFKQLTAEHLVRVVNRRTRQVTLEWHVQPGRENHWLDCRVYARAAATQCGLDRHATAKAAESQASITHAAQPVAPPQAPATPPVRLGGGWLGGGGRIRVGSGWLGKR